jgi:hypothetical protein
MTLTHWSLTFFSKTLTLVINTCKTHSLKFWMGQMKQCQFWNLWRGPFWLCQSIVVFTYTSKGTWRWSELKPAGTQWRMNVYSMLFQYLVPAGKWFKFEKKFQLFIFNNYNLSHTTNSGFWWRRSLVETCQPNEFHFAFSRCVGDLLYDFSFTCVYRPYWIPFGIHSWESTIHPKLQGVGLQFLLCFNNYV